MPVDDDWGGFHLGTRTIVAAARGGVYRRSARPPRSRYASLTSVSTSMGESVSII